ncbi:MAG: ATP-binding protein [Rickettsia endosymbiont of Glossina mortisans submortisans]|nr:ATP-binding protein [Rickettsia endosymbiont of Glossina mortisans submortisans]
MQGNKLPQMRIGTDDFKTLLLNSDVFVDKSLMVQELLEDSAEVILITRPRRWGKSLNMSMLQRFFEVEVDEKGIALSEESRVNHKLFTGGEINLGIKGKKILKPLKVSAAKYAMAQQGNYPVILLNLKDVKGSSYQEILEGVKRQLLKLFSNYHHLKNYYFTNSTNSLNDGQKEQLERYFSGNFNLEDTKDALRFLSELLFKHFNQKVYILIDEYDTPINTAYLELGGKSEEFEKVLKLFRGMLGSSLKSNPYLEKGVITGILRIAKANLFSDLNNVTEYTLLDNSFSKFYGFTQEEVDELLTKVPLETNPNQIKDWYNGYNFGNETIYNPWSIMQCLSHKGQLDHYWLDSGGTSLIDKALLSDEIQEDLQQLTAGGSILSPITKQISFADIEKPVGLFSLLLFSGYLNPITKEPEKNIYELSIPNKEVKYIYETRLLQWVTDKLNIDSSKYYSFVALLAKSQIEEFKEELQRLLRNSTSFYQTGEHKGELFYNGFMLGLLNTITVTHIIDSEKETGTGRADIVLIPKIGQNNNAIIIEYKVAKKEEDLELAAESGLAQINNKQYDTKLKEYAHVQKIIKISMAFCGKEVALQYQLDQALS